MTSRWFDILRTLGNARSRRKLVEHFGQNSLQTLEQRTVPTHLLPAPLVIEPLPHSVDAANHSSEPTGHQSPHKLQYASAIIIVTLSNSTEEPLSVAIAKRTKKTGPGDTFPVTLDKNAKPGKSIRLHTAVIYDANDAFNDFAIAVHRGGTILFQKEYVIVPDDFPTDPHGSEINPKYQQIDIAVLPGNDIRVSVNPKS